MSPRTHILFYYEFVCIMLYVLYLHILYLSNYLFSFVFFAYFIFLICFCKTFCFFCFNLKSAWTTYVDVFCFATYYMGSVWTDKHMLQIYTHAHIFFFFFVFLCFFSNFLCCLLFAMCGIVTQLFYIIPVYIFYVGTNSQKHASFLLIFNCNLKDTKKHEWILVLFIAVC